MFSRFFVQALETALGDGGQKTSIFFFHVLEPGLGVGIGGWSLELELRFVFGNWNLELEMSPHNT